MIKKVLAVLGIVTAAGAPAIYAATRPATTEAGSPGAVAPVTTSQTADTMICPLTGEEIEPCCCPLNDEKK